MSEASGAHPRQALSGRDGFTVLHSDQWMLVLDKDSGLLSVPGIGPEKADCLAARVQGRYPGARIVHRLDRDTSGVIVMAMDAESHRHLSVQFQERGVEKVYEAMVAGGPAEDAGCVDLPIGKDFQSPPRQRVDHVHGRPSRTRWRVLQRLEDPVRTRMELIPLTGRSHQLRVHLLQLGLPILGDDLYATPEVRGWAPRLLLHARRLTLRHPARGETMTFEAPVPF